LAWGAGVRVVSAGFPWISNLRLPGFRRFFLSDCLSFPREFLARRNPLVESSQQLRHAVSGTMEHAGALSSSAVLSAFPGFMVAGCILPVALVFGRLGNVFAGESLDPKPFCRRLRRGRVFLQRTHAEQSHVA